jgi:hypothetical protein
MIEKYELLDNHVLEIEQDENPESPREWDNLGKMVCFHNRYRLGDNHDYNKDNYDSWEELEAAIRETENVHTILPIYMYDHSGITVSTSAFSCRWDSGQIGFIYATKERIEEMGCKEHAVGQLLEDEIKMFDDFITGNIYGFRIYKVDKCNLGHEHETEIESCWGFYGDDIYTNGIMDYVSPTLLPDSMKKEKEKVNS